MVAYVSCLWSYSIFRRAEVENIQTLASLSADVFYSFKFWKRLVRARSRELRIAQSLPGRLVDQY